jgi:hypothetical protein
MDPKKAALAFVADHVSPRNRGTIVFEIDDPGAKPPQSGEVGLRWMGGAHYGPYQEGVTILKYDGYNSKLLISKIETEGEPSKEELEEAVMKTDEHRLYRAVAQQTYEILWWLRHVRFQNEPKSWSGGTSSSGDNLGRFWMKPDGPSFDPAIIGEPCGQCMDWNEDAQNYASFANILLRRVATRSGIKDRYPIPKIGTWKPRDEDDEFLHNRVAPEPDDKKATLEYVGRLCAILKNPDRRHHDYAVMERLVPTSDPLRYQDARINEALRTVFRRGVEAKEASNLRIDGGSAAVKLGMHDATEVFDELIGLGKTDNFLLEAAARIAGRHPELRTKLVEPIKANWSLEAIWRADLRELEGAIQQFAGSDDAYTLFYKYTPEQEKRHHAAVLLATWHEPDKLTKTKLDIMLTGAIGDGADIPEVLRKEFAELSESDQLKVRNFVTWMRTVEVPWSRRHIEDAFTPHTPRPDILFER